MVNYVPVHWEDGDDAAKEKLNQMAANQEFFYQNIPTVQHSWRGSQSVIRNPRLFGTTVVMPRNDQSNNQLWVPFGDFFTPGCMPACTVSIIRQNNVRLVRCFIRLSAGPGTQSGSYPDHTGVLIRSWIDPRWTGKGHDYGAVFSLIALGY